MYGVSEPDVYYHPVVTCVTCSLVLSQAHLFIVTFLPLIVQHLLLLLLRRRVHLAGTCKRAATRRPQGLLLL